MNIEEQIAELRDKSTTFANDHGADVSKNIDSNSNLVLNWLDYLRRHKTGVADELLDGAASSLIEAAACAGLGLIRPAMFAMRTEVDVILTWLFFKDHKVEWENVNLTGDGFKLKKELFEYFNRYIPGFGERYGILKQTALRKEQDVYRFLSAHIHSQSSTTLPGVKNLSDVVQDKRTADELVLVSFSVDEYVNDLLLSIYIRDWAHLPKILVSNLNARFTTDQQRRTFYATI